MKLTDKQLADIINAPSAFDEPEETGIICDDCGKATAHETTCPFAEEIDDEIIECNLCRECYHERCMDI